MRTTTSRKEFSSSRWTAAIRLLTAAAFLVVGLPRVWAQQESEQKGVDQGNYNIKQSIEFGGRFVDIVGDGQAYNTFVNLQQGPRLLGFTTEIRSLDHHASFFDRLYFSNFGYGGDPNDVSLLRMSKNKWYNFNALFRRDENFWDYSLQANPLNPYNPTAVPPVNVFANAPAGFTPVINLSPRLLNTRRKLGDYSLLLLPQSKVRFRVGYARNINEGPSFTTIHQGTEELLFQNWKTTVNTYRVGVDFRWLPRTNISYDEIWNYYKGESGAIDYLQLPGAASGALPLNGNPTVFLSNGTPVDIGVSLNATAGQPCGNNTTTFLFPPPPATSGTINPTCSAYLNYLTHGRVRTNTPTEQISLQSNYWKQFDLSARFSYTGGDANEFGFIESLTGRESRTNLRNGLTNGSVLGRRVVSSSDFGVTWHATDNLSFLDSFHFSNFHNPMQFNSSICSFFSANLLTGAGVFATTATVPLNCVAPSDGVAGTPTHTASSGADIAASIYGSFLKLDEKTNLAEVDYQFTPRLGGHLGFRYRSRSEAESALALLDEIFFPGPTATLAARGVCARIDTTQPVTQANLPEGCTLNSDTSISFVTPDTTPDVSDVQLHESSGLVGVWARPLNNWRISFDAEVMHADTTFTRISPKESKEVRLRTTYKPAGWLNLNGSIRVWEGRNPPQDINNKQHDRAYGFSALFQPNDKFGLEIAYDYNDVFSQILICYVSNAAPAGLSKCPGSTVLVEQLSTYTNKSHYGSFDVMWTPFHRLTGHLGANLTGTSGSALNLLPVPPSASVAFVPTASLDSKYLLPYGGLDYRFAKNWTGKAYWGYYGYREDSTFLSGAEVPQDIFAPRNFHANTLTLSLRYAF